MLSGEWLLNICISAGVKALNLCIDVNRGCKQYDGNMAEFHG